MQEEGHNLSIDVRSEQEGSHIGEGYDRWGEEQKEHPNSLIVLIEDKGQHNNQQDRDVGHHDVKDQVRGPVASQGHA